MSAKNSDTESLVLCFIDYEKAFHKVNPNKLREVVFKQKIGTINVCAGGNKIVAEFVLESVSGLCTLTAR